MKSIKFLFSIFLIFLMISIYPNVSSAQICPSGATCGEEIEDNGDLTVSNNITANDDNEAYGVYGEGTISELDNSEGWTISANATATSEEGYAEAYAYGVYAETKIETLTNSGTIEANATAVGENAYAYSSGVEAYSIDELNNSGTISANATAEGEYAYAEATGVSAWTHESDGEDIRHKNP